MKRFRVYQQENGRLHKLHGRYYLGDGKHMSVAHGYDTFNEAEAITKQLENSHSQYCIIDFERQGLIVSIGLPIL